METTPAAGEATVSIAPVETVNIAKRDLAVLVRAAGLLAAVFEGEVEPDEIVDEAAEAGLTVETDAPEDAPDDSGDDDGVDTYVTLSPDLYRAIALGEELCGGCARDG